MPGVVVLNKPGVYLVNEAGVSILLEDGAALPGGIKGVAIVGKDGTDARFFRVAADGTLRVDPTGTTTQPVSAGSLPLPAGASTEATLAVVSALLTALEAKDFSTETTLAAISVLLTSLDGKDFATQTTLAAVSALLTLLEGKDFSTETTLAAVEVLLTSLDGKDFATETTLVAVGALLTSLDGKDFSTETTLAAVAALLTSLDGKDYSTETTLAAVAVLLTSIDGKDYATQTTLAAVAATLTSIDGKDFATETTLLALGALLTSLDAKDFATETTLAAATVLLTSLDGKDYSTETTLAAIQVLLAQQPTVVSTVNSSTTVPLIASPFTGTSESMLPYVELSVTLTTAQPGTHTGTVFLEFSPDGTNWDLSLPVTYDSDIGFLPVPLRVVQGFYRARYVPDDDTLTAFRLQTILHRRSAKMTTRFLTQDIDAGEPVEVVRAVSAAQQPDGDFINAKASGSLTGSTTPLGAGGEFLSDWFDSDGWVAIELVVVTDQLSADDGVKIEFTDDVQAGTPTTQFTIVRTFDEGALARGFMALTVPAMLDGLRIRYTNGATPQGSLFLNASLRASAAQIPQSSVELPIDATSLAATVRAVGVGRSPDGGYFNVPHQGIFTAGGTTTPLSASATFRGVWFPWAEDYVGTFFNVFADTDGSLFLDFSQDEAPVDGDDTSLDGFFTIPYETGTFLRRFAPVQSRFCRLRYVNGLAAQSEFTCEITFLTTPAAVPLQPLGDPPNSTHLAGFSHSVIAARDESASGAYQQIHAKLIDGLQALNVTVAAIEGTVVQRPADAWNTARHNVGAVAPVQLGPVALAGRTAVKVVNVGPSRIAIGPTNAVTFATGEPMPANSFASMPLDEDQEVWAIAEDTGGTENIQNLNGAASAGTADTPANALTSNDVRALVGSGETVRISTLAITPTLTDIATMRIGCEARKQPDQGQTVAFVGNAIAEAGNVGSIVTATTLPAATNRFYLAAISRENENASVTSVEGGGLTWMPLHDVTAGASRRLDVWWAFGSPGVAFNVTATFSVLATNSHIAVSEYSGADPISPIHDSGTNVGTGTAVTGPLLAKEAKHLGYLATVKDNTSHTAGTGYTERSDQTTGSGAATDRDGLATETKSLVTPGTEAATATLSGSTTWGAIGVVINNAPAIDPIVTLSYELSAVPGATSGPVTFTDSTDEAKFVEITADEPWVFADIPNLTLIATGLTIGAAECEIDRLFLEVVEASGNTARVNLSQIRVTPS